MDKNTSQNIINKISNFKFQMIINKNLFVDEVIVYG